MSNWFIGRSSPRVVAPLRFGKDLSPEEGDSLGEEWLAMNGSPGNPRGDKGGQPKRSSKGRKSSRATEAPTGDIHFTPSLPSPEDDCPFEANVTESPYVRSERVRKLSDSGRLGR